VWKNREDIEAPMNDARKEQDVMSDQLAKLEALKSDGILGDEEFCSAKAKVEASARSRLQPKPLWLRSKHHIVKSAEPGKDSQDPQASFQPTSLREWVPVTITNFSLLAYLGVKLFSPHLDYKENEDKWQGELNGVVFYAPLGLLFVLYLAEAFTSKPFRLIREVQNATTFRTFFAQVKALQPQLVISVDFHHFENELRIVTYAAQRSAKFNLCIDQSLDVDLTRHKLVEVEFVPYFYLVDPQNLTKQETQFLDDCRHADQHTTCSTEIKVPGLATSPVLLKTDFFHNPEDSRWFSVLVFCFSTLSIIFCLPYRFWFIKQMESAKIPLIKQFTCGDINSHLEVQTENSRIQIASPQTLGNPLTISVRGSPNVDVSPPELSRGREESHILGRMSIHEGVVKKRSQIKLVYKQYYFVLKHDILEYHEDQMAYITNKDGGLKGSISTNKIHVAKFTSNGINKSNDGYHFNVTNKKDATIMECACEDAAGRDMWVQVLQNSIGEDGDARRKRFPVQGDSELFLGKEEECRGITQSGEQEHINGNGSMGFGSVRRDEGFDENDEELFECDNHCGFCASYSEVQTHERNCTFGKERVTKCFEGEGGRLEGGGRGCGTRSCIEPECSVNRPCTGLSLFGYMLGGVQGSQSGAHREEASGNGECRHRNIIASCTVLLFALIVFVQGFWLVCVCVCLSVGDAGRRIPRSCYTEIHTYTISHTLVPFDTLTLTVPVTSESTQKWRTRKTETEGLRTPKLPKTPRNHDDHSPLAVKPHIGSHVCMHRIHAFVFSLSLCLLNIHVYDVKREFQHSMSACMYNLHIPMSI
jgi:hypothetical protein